MSKNKKIKIAIIEDDPFLSVMYIAKFESDGFSVFGATDGHKGLDLVESKLPDLVMLDIMLPKMNGFEVLERIRSNPKTKNIPVILLTNLNQGDEVKRGMELGAVDYLVKAHFMPSEVVEKAKKALGLIVD